MFTKPRLFWLTKYLDQGGRRVTLVGTIDGSPALLSAERAAFSSDLKTLEAFHAAITKINNLGQNDIYRWYLASSGTTKEAPADLKINLIYPCTDNHIKKYSPQAIRMVTETPTIYQQHVRPYMKRMRDEGRLNWVFNILEGRSEQEHILLRDPGQSPTREEAFLLTPDLNWDRKTLTSLHLLALVARRDFWSLRDLRKRHVTWLKHMRTSILRATVDLYTELDMDMLKLYIHCMLTLLGELCLMQLTRYRSTHLLPFPHPRCPRYVRSHKHASSGQSSQRRKLNLAIGDYGWWSRGRHGRRQSYLSPRRSERPLEICLPSPQREQEGLIGERRFGTIAILG